MEYWDVYDRDRVRTGRILPRGTSEPDAYRLVVHICIFNAAGELLIQQRQASKKSWAGLWDFSVGGCAVAGETSQMAAHREVLEEIGLNLDFSCLQPHLTVHFAQGFDDIYLLEHDVPAEALRLQTEEVQAVCWATEQEVLARLQAGTFIPYYPDLVKLLFASRRQRGCHAAPQKK